jgi:hypothetical protein
MGRKGTRNLVRKLIPDSIRILGPPTSVLIFSNSTLYYGHFQFTLNILVFNCTCSSFRISRKKFPVVKSCPTDHPLQSPEQAKRERILFFGWQSLRVQPQPTTK